MANRRTPVHLVTSSEHKKATKCHCHRINRKIKDVVSNNSTTKRMEMEKKWNKDQYGNKV